jgi:hypothetical protein
VVDEGKLIAVIGLGVAVLVVGSAVALGFWQAKEGCEDLARREGREIVDNRWFGKGDYCVTRDPDGATHATNETVWFLFLVVLASIPLGLAAGGGAIALYGGIRRRRDRGPTTG